MNSFDIPEWVKEKDRFIVKSTFTEICSKYNITHADLTSSRKPNYIAVPRRIAYYILYRHTTMTAKQVGAILGGRDHKTVLYGVNECRGRCESNDDFRKEVERLEFAILAAINIPKLSLVEPNLGHNYQASPQQQEGTNDQVD